MKSASSGVVPVAEDHSQTGGASLSPGRWTILRRINVPLLRRSSPSSSIQAERRLSRGWTRSQARASALP